MVTVAAALSWSINLQFLMNSFLDIFSGSLVDNPAGSTQMKNDERGVAEFLNS